MARPSSTAPLASFAVAESAPVSPFDRESVVGVISIRATEVLFTTMLAAPYLPPLEPSIRATPSAMAVTTPDDVTVATAGLFETHAIGRPLIGLPPASARAAVSVAVAPT